MTITGNLATMGLPDLLGWAAQGHKSGVLVVQHEGREKRVFFARGRVVAAVSSEPTESLAHLVVARGLIDEGCRDEALRTLDGRDSLLRRYLVNNDLVSAEAMTRLLLDQVRESVCELFDWPEGEFHFVDGESPTVELGEAALEAEPLIAEAAERRDSWVRIRRFIPGPRSIPVAVGFLDDPKLSAEERSVARAVDDQRSVLELQEVTGLSELEVCRALVAALERGRLKIVVPSAEPPPPSVGGSTGITTLDSESLLEAAGRHLEGSSFERTLRYLKAARTLEPECPTVRARVEEMERRLCEQLQEAGVHDGVVPRLRRPIEELSELDVSQDAGFLLTRIDGSYDLRSILKITPLSPLEGRVLVLRLRDQGLIELA